MCGKEPGGVNADKQGVCPIAVDRSANRVNGGVNGGRICWMIAETYCKNGVKCSTSHNGSSCSSCEFRQKVMKEEGLLNVCRATGMLLDESLLNDQDGKQ